MIFYDLMLTYDLNHIDNMVLDSFLACAKDKNFIRLYTWRDKTLSLGLGSKVEHINMDNVKLNNIQLVRRESGGGILNHFGDISFSFIQNTENKVSEQYQFVKKTIEGFLLNHSFKITQNNYNKISSLYCNNEVSGHEISVENKKMVSIAQKYMKRRYLTHGSISVHEEFDLVKSLLNIKIDKDTMTYASKYSDKINIEDFFEYISKVLNIKDIIKVEDILNTQEYKEYKDKNLHRFLV